MWMELTPEEKEVYNERARKINEEGQGNLLKSTVKYLKSKGSCYGRPKTAFNEFTSKILSQRLKAACGEIMKEWHELSAVGKEKYEKLYEEEFKAYNLQMEKYKGGEKFTENKRNRKVLMAKIKVMEEEMEKPKLLASTSFLLFGKENREHFQGKNVSEIAIGVSAMWRALDEGVKTEYKARCHKLRCDWQQEVAEWEARNANSSKMTELRTYKNMMFPSKKQKTF